MARHRRCRRAHIKRNPKIRELNLFRRRMTAMRVVEVHFSVANLAETFSAMRRWIDHNNCTAVNFDYMIDPPGEVVVEIAFDEDDLAEKFEQEFEKAERISTSPAN